MATIEVDGKIIEAENGQMLIEVTDAAGIYIPRFCYHEKLSVAANCRMCLVEVEKAPKPMPACATPVMDGMKVHTGSRVAREAQKGTMEFLLINHPLDCPVCDQGGECPLQDQAMGWGKDDSRYLEPKRVAPNPDIGPLIATEMTRCIHCTRCVRFGEEIAGVMEMGAPGRGESTRIGTFLGRSIDSEVSGNMIDICPVGALTSKPYRFSARSWELRNHPGISPHDCVGSNIRMQTLRGVVERVLPVENEAVNECWLSDRDRFSYQGVNSDQRLSVPMIRDGQDWREVSWETALEHSVAGIKTVIGSGSAADIGALAAPGCTLEEFYLLQKLMRGLGSDNVDHRLQQQDFGGDDVAPVFPALETPIAAIGNIRAGLLVGSNLRKEQPLLSVRLRKAVVKNGAVIGAVNVMDYPQSFDLAESALAAPSALVSSLAGVALAVARNGNVDLPAEIASLSDAPVLEKTASELLQAADQGLILLGANAMQNPAFASLHSIAQWIADQTGARLGILPPANAAAAWLAGCVPHRAPHGEALETPGRNAGEMLRQGQRGYLLLGTEPELDALDGAAARKAMQDAEFVVQISPFLSETMLSTADVLLPMAAFTEAAGTFVNCEGRAQQSCVATDPPGEARPAWKILRVLGNFFDLSGFDQVTLDDVRAEAAPGEVTPSARLGAARYDEAAAGPANGVERIADMPMYRGEMTLRHAGALQATKDNPPPAIHVHPHSMAQLQLEHGQSAVVGNGDLSVSLPVVADSRVTPGCVYIPAGFSETAIGLHADFSITAGDAA